MYGDYDLMMLQRQLQEQQVVAQQDQMMLYAAMQNSQAMQEQAMMRKLQAPPKQYTPSKREILEYLKMYTSARDVVACDEFETQRARHICEGTKDIRVLEMCRMPVNMGFSVIYVEYFICPNCGKLIYNRSSISV